MKKPNHYVQWQQLKQLHKTTYVGSYEPLVSWVGLCVSAELLDLFHGVLFGKDFNGEPRAQSWDERPDTKGWHRLTGLCPCQGQLSLLSFMFWCLGWIVRALKKCCFECCLTRGSISTAGYRRDPASTGRWSKRPHQQLSSWSGPH